MKLLLLLPLITLTSSALAHVGADNAQHHFTTGFNHPIGGLDHCLAMIAVGIVAVFLGGKAKAGLPIAFLAAMLLGFLVGATKIAAFPGFEPMILASVIGLGLILLVARPVPLIVALGMTAVFGFAHGFVHGVEGALTMAYATGFLLATALLHIMGMGAALALINSFQNEKHILFRAMGGGLALAGLVLATL
jgi:urease accessory protein